MGGRWLDADQDFGRPYLSVMYGGRIIVLAVRISLPLTLAICGLLGSCEFSSVKAPPSW
jgi:hypothetical protein